MPIVYTLYICSMSHCGKLWKNKHKFLYIKKIQLYSHIYRGCGSNRLWIKKLIKYYFFFTDNIVILKEVFSKKNVLRAAKNKVRYGYVWAQDRVGHEYLTVHIILEV